MNPVVVRGVEIGLGMPKICVPIVAIDQKSIIDEVKSFLDIPVDIVEWRADWYNDVFDKEKVIDTLRLMRKELGETPILFTFRTHQEGGEKKIDKKTYIELNIAVARSGIVDLIDVEGFTGDECVKDIIEKAHDAGVKVIVSNHDFVKTPTKEEMKNRLIKMQKLGADITKIAVMPQSPKDVLNLLETTYEMECFHGDRPVITMSMGGIGVISRLTGEVFGSAMTFGAAKKASAPGQIKVQEMQKILSVMHESI